MSLVLGVTGHRGVGKSAILSLLQKRGFFRIDADLIVADLYKNEAVPLIAEGFGPEFIKNNEVDKIALKKYIEDNPSELQKLNDLVHPPVHKKVRTLLNGKHFVAIEAVYFKKGELLDLVDKLILLRAETPHVEPFYSFLDDFYMKNADTFDFVIDNNGDLSDLERSLVEILEQLEYKG